MTHPNNPLDKLQTLTAAEVSRRASERAQNRKRLPSLAWISDEVLAVFPDAKFLHGEEGGVVIGKVPPLPPGCVTLDWTTHALIEADFTRKKGKK